MKLYQANNRTLLLKGVTLGISDDAHRFICIPSQCKQRAMSNINHVVTSKSITVLLIGINSIFCGFYRCVN